MEIRQLKTFLAIAHYSSFVQAADSLGYAQSTVTNHIQLLESELGVRLFERLGHKITLTHQGIAFLPYADQIIKLSSEAQTIAAHPGEPTGKLIIGTGESLGTYRLPQILRQYRRLYPKVEMIIKFDNCTNINSFLKNGIIDVGIIINEMTEDEDLLVHDLSKEQMLFLISPEHPLAKQNTVSVQDLAETSIILSDPGCSYRFTMERILKEYKVNPSSIMEASSVESIKQLVILGLGVSILPRFTVEKELSALTLRALPLKEPETNYHVKLLYHKDKWLSPALQAFLTMAKDYLQK